jgi:hypothetical protein
MVLRAGWLNTGDLIAIDHRVPSDRSAFELFALGRPWLGPTWTSGTLEGPVAPARMTRWVSNGAVDLTEWSMRAGTTRVVRSAVLLKGRHIGLLAEQVEGASGEAISRLAMPERVEASAIAENRGLKLTAMPTRASVRVYPLGLPCRSYPTERGAFQPEGRELVLRQQGLHRRQWLPLLLTWEPLRDRKKATWRSLTVAERGKVCGPDTAFAARFTWGRDETLVVYRSLAKPALRSFLGHQTRSRFLVGLFDREGRISPILNLDD